jgi:L-iditol 2-dehydrogenase
MPTTMKLGMYFRNHDVRVEERPVPSIGPGEVLVRVASCGVCASDTMEWYREPQTRANGGINTGHEIAGEIVQAGRGVRKFKTGDRVVVSHHFPCGVCTVCRDGNETACEAMHRKHIDPGGFAQYVRILESGVAQGLFLLPRRMTYEQGSLVEPLGCVVRSVRKTLPIAGHSVLVIGSGLAGLLHIKLAHALGAARIFAVDTNDSRVQAARCAGADDVFLGPCELPRADRVFVCTGSAKAGEMALEAVNRGGRIMYFATAGPDMKVTVNLTRFWLTQPAIGFSYGAAPRDIREAMALIRDGKVSVDDLVTHSFGIEQIQEAFDLVATPKGNSLKVIIQPNRGAPEDAAMFGEKIVQWLPIPTVAIKRPWAMRGVWMKLVGQAIQKLSGYA